MGRRRPRLGAWLGGGAAAAITAAAWAASQGAAGKPAALAEALEQRFPGAVVDGVDTDVEMGLLLYDVYLYHGGREVEVEALGDGTLLAITTPATLADLPAAARDALPADLRPRHVQVERIEVLHGESPRAVHHVRAGDRSWLFTGDGTLDAGTTTLSAPTDTPVIAMAAGAPAASAQPVTNIADVRRGQQVTLAGTVDRLRDTDEFVLRDATGTIQVYIGWRNAMPVRVGDAVTVAGFADDDTLPGLRPEVYASAITTADGRIVTLDANRE